MSLQVIIALLVIIVLALVGLVVWVIQRGMKKSPAEGEGMMMLQRQVESLRGAFDAKQMESLRVMNEQLAHLTAQFSSRLDENARALEGAGKTIGERMDGAARVVGDVQKSLVRLDEANKRIYELGQGISGLEKLLRAPKLRGGLGEFFLGDLLAQILPSECFSMQKEFKSGQRVDAVICIGDRFVPVDAKFPMESFQRMIETENEVEQKRAYKEFARAVKTQVELIAKSYIREEEGTFPFALMYIPAENVYYETIIKYDQMADGEGIAEYALKRRVIPVSPNNLYAYLQTIIMGLNGLRIEKQASEVVKKLGTLTREFGRFAEDFRVLGKHITNIKSKYEASEKHLDRFMGKLEHAAGLDYGDSGEPQEKLLAENNDDKSDEG